MTRLGDKGINAEVAAAEPLGGCAGSAQHHDGGAGEAGVLPHLLGDGETVGVWQYGGVEKNQGIRFAAVAAARSAIRPAACSAESAGVGAMPQLLSRSRRILRLVALSSTVRTAMFCRARWGAGGSVSKPRDSISDFRKRVVK